MEATKIPEHLSFYRGTVDELFEMHPTTDELHKLLVGRPYQHCPWKVIENLIAWELRVSSPGSNTYPLTTGRGFVVIYQEQIIDLMSDKATEHGASSWVFCMTPVELALTLARLRSGITRPTGC